MIGAFLEFIFWTFFDPCILVLLWRLGIFGSWFLCPLGILVLGFFASLLQTDNQRPL
jgi:hypothetical protein